MNKYILISTKFEGYIVYGFNKQGYLMHFENCSWGMNDNQIEAVLQHLRHALGEGNFKMWATNCGYKTIKLELDLSFERFWREFDMARDRFKAEALWRKMKDEERQYALYSLAAYKRYCKRNPWYTHMYAEKFLSKGWRDEWDKVADAPQVKAK